MHWFSNSFLSTLGKPFAGDREVQSVEKVPSLIIVARDQPELWHAMTRQFAADPKVQVLQDRRRWERRQRIQKYDLDQRGPDRRRPASLEHNVRYRSFVIIRRQDGTPEG